MSHSHDGIWPSNKKEWATNIILFIMYIERRRRGQQGRRLSDDITDLVDLSVNKLWEIVKDREA